MASKFCRHICPHNCYNTCGLVSLVEDGKITGLYGDPAHGYSRGHLCRFLNAGVKGTLRLFFAFIYGLPG